MICRMKLYLTIIIYLSGIVGVVLCYEDMPPVFEFVEEWNLWKTAHQKQYNSRYEELEKHLVWLSNKAYVEQHNINAKKGFYSYEVKLNHFADMVSLIINDVNR